MLRWSLFLFSVEIIRLSDKTFKETIKDVELTPHRSTTKEGYISLDPSKPLPHEYEEGRMTRYSNYTTYYKNNPQSAVDIAITTVNEALGPQRPLSLDVEYSTEPISFSPAYENNNINSKRIIYPNETIGFIFSNHETEISTLIAVDGTTEADKVANGGEEFIIHFNLFVCELK